MFEQLMEMVQQNAQQDVVQNPAIPNEQNDAVMKEAANSIQQEMELRLQNGGPKELKAFFEGAKSGSPEHPAVQSASNNFMGSLMEKFGINGDTAKGIAASLIPIVMNKMFNKAKDPNQGGFDIGSILGSLTGGSQNINMGGQQQSSGGGFMEQASRIGASMGLDKDGDGDTDLSDLMAMFK